MRYKYVVDILITCGLPGCGKTRYVHKSHYGRNKGGVFFCSNQHAIDFRHGGKKPVPLATEVRESLMDEIKEELRALYRAHHFTFNSEFEFSKFDIYCRYLVEVMTYHGKKNNKKK